MVKLFQVDLAWNDILAIIDWACYCWVQNLPLGFLLAHNITVQYCPIWIGWETDVMSGINYLVIFVTAKLLSYHF